MALPTLTPEQRAEALKKAAAARTARKELRDAIASGKETIPGVLGRAKSDQIVGKTKVADLLKSLPGYGPAKVSAGTAGMEPASSAIRMPKSWTRVSPLHSRSG